jgi:nonsense-mediated mRNA decay protein 3
MPRLSGSDMAITEQICPRCGRPSETGAACPVCQAEQTPWFRCDSRVISIRCPVCGARKSGSTWTDSEEEREKLGPDLVQAAIHLNPDVKQPSIRMDIRELSVNRSYADVSVQGLLYGIPVAGTCRVEIAWQKEQCDRCNRISGNYHEGVVQVRAEGRKPRPRELETAIRIATELEEAMIAGGERLSFIVRIDETRDGLDITVGSQHIGQEIAAAICQRLGGRYTTHPKLIGEKAGIRLYRVTYSLRLPRFSKGDVFMVHGRYGEVIQVESHSIRYLDLASGAVRSVRETDAGRLIGNAADAETTLVAYRDRDIIGLLEPGTGITRECAAGSRPDISPGQTIRVLRDKDTLILVG